jgi:hypothetical protein
MTTVRTEDRQLQESLLAHDDLEDDLLMWWDLDDDILLVTDKWETDWTQVTPI